MNSSKILASACLCGIQCKYNGGDNYREDIFQLHTKGEIIPICPEVLGGLSTPRVPCEIEKGFSGEDVLDGTARILNAIGEDVTENFINGAEKTVKFAKEINAKKVLFKQGSPSCGCARIYNGTFSHTTKIGNGVATAALIREGFEVESVE